MPGPIPIPVADDAIAQVALTNMFRGFCDSEGEMYSDQELPGLIAKELLVRAARVRFQPSTRQLVLTFDLAFNTSEPDTTSGPVT